MVIEFEGLEISDKKFYVVPKTYGRGFEICEGEISGFSYISRMGVGEKRVDFWGANGISLKNIFDTHDDAVQRIIDLTHLKLERDNNGHGKGI